MRNKALKYLLVFSLAFIFSLFFFYVVGPVYCDEVWVYGFSYNLSNGMMIYRDYNVLQMPLYFLIASHFIKFLGSYLISMHIFDCLLFAGIILMLYTIIRLKVFIMLPIFMFFWPSGYNLLCLFFLILIIYLIHIKKANDLLIAFIVGLCFITKQNIGIFLFIPMFILSKNKMKSIICFFIPFLILSVYLVYNDAFSSFFNYSVLGMFDFGGENKHFNYVFVALFIINVVILLYWLFKSKFKDKELFYVLMFQFMMYPIFDDRHYVCSMFPMLYLILKRINNKYWLKMLFIFIYWFELALFSIVGIDITLEKNLDFLRNSGDLDILSCEVKDYVGDNENFFFTDFYSYYIKLYYDIPIGQYDLLLSGNVGYRGMEKKFGELSKLCSQEVCYFFSKESKDDEKDGILVGQFGSFYDYIRNNYDKVDSLYEFDIYTSEIKK